MPNRRRMFDEAQPTRTQRTPPGRGGRKAGPATQRRPSTVARPTEGYLSETIVLRPGHAYTIGAVVITPDTLASVRILHPRTEPLTVEALAAGPTRRRLSAATPPRPSPAANAPRAGMVPLAGQLSLF